LREVDKISIFKKSFAPIRRTIVKKLMSSHFSEFKLRVNVDAPIEKIYAAWATSAGLESWFLKKAGLVAGAVARQPGDMAQKGDEYEFFWWGYSDCVSHKGRVVSADGKNHFTFTFSQDLPVSISMYKECDETIVELMEVFDPADDEAARKHYLGNMKGWIFYLTNLKSVLEGGLDLRNRKSELTNVITA
jgi:uncharacterized protein YndB with AHSA1/START domain